MELFPNEELLTKCLKHAFHELSEEITDEQVNKILSPVLEKLKDGKLNNLAHHDKDNRTALK